MTRRSHQVLVATEGGKRAVDCYLDSVLYPGLAVHLDSIEKWWVVTHMASGMAMLGGCNSRREAESAAKAFARCADCTLSLQELAPNDELRNLALSFTRAQSRWRAGVVHRTAGSAAQ